MNRIEKALEAKSIRLFSKLKETIDEVNLLLGKYDVNFTTYTDHSIEHVKEVFDLASELLTPTELENLNEDELYILACACYLHDVGMCIPKDRISTVLNAKKSEHHTLLLTDSAVTEEFIRNIHHEISHDFILKEWEALKIENEKYAKAIALVAQGHRKVDLSNPDVYEAKHFVKNGRDFVCLPYLAAIIRVADELDVTNVRTPRLLTKYYMPNSETSVKEWKKHIATSQINFTEDKVSYKVICTDQSIYAALQEQFEKIQYTINYGQKIIRGLPNTESRIFSLNLRTVEAKYEFQGFDPKGIKYSFDVQNVITAFIGDDLYDDKLVAIREALQNSIDSCRYRKSLLGNEYIPKIHIVLDNEKVIIEDNGMGMDEFIIETFFGRLGSSFYEQEKVKNTFEAIGQFGVGVFSYFLLGEYIDIETKTDKTKALKFRIDKDPKNYFHFFAQTSRTTSGTTITIFLRNEYKGKYPGTSVESYIGDIFRFIEFPIEISYDKSKSIIESQDFNVDFRRDIVPKLAVLHADKESNLKLLEVNIDNEYFTGHCSMIVLNDDEKPFQNIGGWLDSENFRTPNGYRQNYSVMNFCQKGIYVTSYESTLLKYLLGNIDLKKKIKINIDRNSFSDLTAIRDFRREFEGALLEKIGINYFKNADPNKKVFLTEHFLACYVERIEESDRHRIKPILENILYFSVYYKGEITNHSLKKIYESFDSIAVLFSLKQAQSISIEMPTIIASGWRYGGSYNRLIQILTLFYKMTPYLYCDNQNRGIQVFEKRESTLEKILDAPELEKFHYLKSSTLYSNATHVMLRLWDDEASKYAPSQYFFNANHEFLQLFLKYIIDPNLDSFNRKIFKSIIEYLHRIHERIGASVSLKELNSLCAKLDIGYQYKFKNEDFAISVPSGVS